MTEESGSGSARSADVGRELMRRMLRVRRFEERVQALAALGEFPGVVLVESPANVGFGAGVNQGLALAALSILQAQAQIRLMRLHKTINDDDLRALERTDPVIDQRLQSLAVDASLACCIAGQELTRKFFVFLCQTLLQSRQLIRCELHQRRHGFAHCLAHQ